MAFKAYVPSQKDASWGDYWSKTSIEDNLKNCETDGLLPILTRYLPVKGKIIEAGCGLGKWVIYLRNRGYDVMGTDSFAGAIKALKKFDKSLPVKVDKVEKSSFPAGSFEAYLSFGVVEHFEEGPQKSLQEAFRLLKPGGVAVIETPFDNPMRRGIRHLKRLLGKGKPPAGWSFYEYHYTREELINFVREAGFKVLATFPKDDLSWQKSIGLWLDFPKLRQSNDPDFRLNLFGRLLRIIFNPWPEFWSACIVVVGEKP